LRDDDDALRCYLEMMDLDARIRWAYRGELRPPLTADPSTTGSELTGSEPAGAGSKSSGCPAGAAIRQYPHSEAEHSSRNRSDDSPQSTDVVLPLDSNWLRTVALGIAVSAAAMLLVWFSIRGVSRSGTVGMLAQSAGAQWQVPHAALAVGELIPKGQISLLAGVAEITLYDDTRLILEGPVSLEVVSANEIFVNHGTVSVFAGPKASGYTVNTPDARVVDLSTAFMVRVAERGTEVHVIEGEVVANGTRSSADTKSSGDAGDSDKLHLAVRDAVRFNRDTGTVTAIDFVGEQLKLHRNAPLSAIPLGVTGDIRCLEHPPASVVVGEFEHDHQMVLFLEGSNVVLSRTIYADRGSGGEIAAKDGNINMEIPAGARVTSYLLHFDPTTDRTDDPMKRVSGTVTFRSPIVGVFASGAGLYDSDKLLSSDKTRYRGTGGARGLDGLDFVSFSPDRRTIIVNFQANRAADQIRIVTMNGLP